MNQFFAIVNPVAGGGRSVKLSAPALARLGASGLKIDVVESKGPGSAQQLANQAYSQGYRQFLAVGGDGTAHEILNGIFVGRKSVERVSLGFLPFGTGNSFLLDFSQNGAEASLQALLTGQKRRVDLIRLIHSEGELYSLNLLSVGFTADVAVLTNRMFKSLGPIGYLLGVVVGVLKLSRRSFCLKCDDDRDWDNRRALFLSFNNSKYTGGTMLIAPNADATDGLIEFVRWGPISRIGLLRMLPRLYDGTHIEHPLATRRAVRRVEFNLSTPVDIMIDGEVATLRCRTIEIVPSAVEIFI
jgi:diacylglycerol kinase (ATP)